MLDISRRPLPPAASPLDALAGAAKAVPAASLRALPASARLAFRGGERAAGLAGIAFGVELPREACRFNTASGKLALWLGPDEWVLLAPGLDPAPLFEGIEASLGSEPHALVDISSRSVGIELSGARAAFVLNQGCPLDLSTAAFPVGMCTRTIFAKSEIVLIRTAPDAFQIDVWRSFAAYVWGLLEEARREFE
ncbi:sarcosine oxidase subunit gamma family protein [Bosea sp. 117]|uniref:sarcosine oxidase subunit gamma n=1 Tax=Bosea sp. 117 TaxID=1125973 RepID=UPI0004941DEA|nr:sarcosine oxidase subunit gamma family protein [Bosea sp. 117]